MAMDQEALKAVEKVDSCCDVVSCRAGKKKDVAGVSCLKYGSGAVRVSVDD